MKKLKISSLSPQPLILIIAVCTLIAVPLRTFQLSNCIEPATGFWLVKDFSVPLLYGLSAAVIALSLFMSFFSGIMPEPEFSEKRSIPLGIISAGFAVAFLADAISGMSEYIAIFGDFAVDSGDSFFAYTLRTGALAVTFQSVFALLSALYMSLISFSAFAGSSLYSKSKFLALSPVAWSICRMVYRFVEPISFKNVSQLLLQLLLIAVTMIFFLSFARIASKVNEESSMWLLWFSGSTGAFLGFVCSLAPLVLILAGKGSLIPEKYPMQYTDLAFSFFATAVLLMNLPRTVKNRTDAES